VLVNLLKIGSAPNSLASRESSHGRSRGGLLGAHREALPPPGAAPFQDDPPVFGGHANQKTVRALAMPVVRLECAFTLHVTPRLRTESIMLRAFPEGVNAKRFVLESRSFTKRRTPVNSCVFGLSPKFSTPVEKAVEITRYERVGPSPWSRRNQGK